MNPPSTSMSSIGSKAGSSALCWLLPGWQQWEWGQRERSLQLAGMYASFMTLGILTWGTALGLWAIFGGFVVHVVSMTDAIRQTAYPNLSWFVPPASSAAGLGLLFYAPAVLGASMLAWPGATGNHGRVYLVDRGTSGVYAPEAGEFIWIGSKRGAGSPPLAKVIALSGQVVEWSKGRLSVDGQVVEDRPFNPGAGPESVIFEIPERLLLVGYPVDDPSGKRWGLVERDHVEGRAYARFYPIWERRLLQ